MLLTTGFAAAADQVTRDAVEKAQDRRQIRQDARAVTDDRIDLDRFSDLVMRWNDARDAHDGAMLKEIQLQIAHELRRDLAENKVQSQQAKRELAQARREIRSDRREIAKDKAALEAGATAQEKRALRDDRRDLRDDRRDRRDDRRDAKRADELLMQKRDIARDLRDLQHQIDADPSAAANLQERQSELLDRYLKLSQEEIKLGIREYREDRRELREDRRETREDRLQGN
jgi:hypothetical protein